MARGGKRQGAPRTAYSNRTDLQMAPTEFEGQEYGQRAQQVASQQAVPIQRREPVIPQFTPLDAPTEFPERPVTYGLPSGPGAGPEALGGGDDLAALRAILSTADDDTSRMLVRYLLDESL